MTMQYDVKSVYATASGVLVAGRTRLKQIMYIGNGTAGTIIIYDNDTAASGDILWRFISGTAVQPFQVLIPGEGILAKNGLYVTITNQNAVSILHG